MATLSTDGGQGDADDPAHGEGPEFPVVFLTGCEDGVFPQHAGGWAIGGVGRGTPPAYVGITRAEERLYLTRSELRRNWGSPQWFPAVPVLR